jgi:hypothetical protein
MVMKMGIWRWTLASAVVVLLSGTASAILISDPPGVTTNDPAAVVVYPKVVVNVDNCDQTTGFCRLQTTVACTASSDCEGEGTDTIVQLTNTSEFLTHVKCFYVNANGHCSNSETTICTQENFREECPPGGLCVEGWQENDFVLTLTKRQPISWSASDGLSNLPLADQPGQGDPPQFNEGSIPPVAENPFRGELRCIQLDVATELPTDRNDLKGEASIITTDGPLVDARKYTAIGIPAIEGAQDGDPNTLNVGGPSPEYRACPNILTLNHFFENAQVASHGESVVGPVTSELTVVPCAADFLNQEQNLASSVLQFLIFNEFEQRFSTSTRVTCFKEVTLSDIDTRPGDDGDNFSIFAAGVQGTLTGQSRIRPVAGPNEDGYDGRNVLAILEENWASGSCPAATTTDGTELANTLCRSDDDCETGTCTDPGVKTTAANIQRENSTREQGVRIRIPIP